MRRTIRSHKVKIKEQRLLFVVSRFAEYKKFFLFGSGPGLFKALAVQACPSCGNEPAKPYLSKKRFTKVEKLDPFFRTIKKISSRPNFHPFQVHDNIATHFKHFGTTIVSFKRSECL
jgi:hypothetical protein